MMKKMMVLLMTIVFVTFLLKGNNANAEIVSETELFSGKLGFDVVRGQNYGCEGFCLSANGKIVILDSINCSVMVSDENGIEIYSLDNAVYPKEIIVYNEKYYVLDAWGSDSRIMEYGEKFDYRNCYTFPTGFCTDEELKMIVDEANRLTLLFEGKSLSLINGELKPSDYPVIIKRNGDSTIAVSLDDKEWLIDAGKNSFIEFVDYCNEYLVYQRCKVVENCSELMGELSLEIVDKDSNLIGYVRIESNENTFLPHQYAHMTDNGLIIMLATSFGTQIKRIEFDNIIDSNFELLEEKAKAVNQKEMVRTQLMQMVMPRALTGINSGLTRNQVQTRALNMISFSTWMLTEPNVTIPSSQTSVVVLPDYILAIKNSGILNNGGMSSQVGIPYCWGGFDSQYTSNNSGYSSFSAAISAGYIAGNVTSINGSKVSGTAGLDCSGFVSAAYGFSSKQNTNGLYSSLNSVASVDDLAVMDCLVKSGSHALLFGAWLNKSSGQFTLAESNNPPDYDDRAALRTKNISDYIGSGYSLRTMW